MFGIGQFAQIAKVSVRTLRHYDDVGLLRPAAVDAATGYRSYAAAQLAELNRILVLKDLGFTLAEITRMVEAGVSREQLVGMLRLRQAEAERAADDERRRLARVAARIELLTGATAMNDLDTAIVVKPIDDVRLATVREPVEGFDAEFAPIFGRLYPVLFAELGRLGVSPAGPTYALYEQRDDGRIDVLAGVVVDAEAVLDSETVSVRELAAVDRAATLVHRGAMATIMDSYALLEQWMDRAGERPVGFSREVYLECPEDDPDGWVTELQFALADS
ncbi:MAG: MerR family transcriptional regulator [Ilumatobacter sp.]|uniref:MerR family transcriptional regulator n=1 Tax=Ilumatobacter sp. TaxID=1967498 RepID=UPI0026194DD6|nr:MerR family transcriptional regulator [Ilumatobacter sp.]MDJ0767943.1 MerR family transcriptional regulator [Ilumatobacter sp.]